MWMSTIVVVVIVLVVTGLGVAQPSTQTTNTPLKYYCGSYYPMSTTVFFTNRNSTYSQLRSQLSKTGVYYARAEDMVNGDAVYGVAQCRNYLASSECLACFDVAVSALEPCGSANGAHVFLDNCYLRFENYDQFYNDPQGDLDVDVTEICGNESTSQPVKSFNQVVKELLSDISVATPRTPDVYIASTRQLTSGVNATVYAIAQCVENASQAICKNCLSQAYNKLYSCVPASEGRAINVECFMRYSEFPFFQNNQTINLVPFLGTGHSSKSRTIIGVSSSVGLIFLILALFLSFRRWIKSKAVGKGTRCYSYQDLKLATNNFSDEYLIGRGGFAQVFKATIEGGIAVAVKKINVGSRAKKDFENEVNLISNVRHRNLILQLGWCIHGTRLLLVLEYMPHGSLDKFLWGEKKGTLNWKQRCDIILGIARGLVHLHSESHVKIVHRDIKSSNILLDDDFQPKIADFGLARLYLEDQTHVSTRFAGTMGYTSPEYATRGHLSEKVDTYSFGIVALEVISGQSCSDVKYSGPRMEYLLEHAWQLYEKGIHNKLVDEAIDPNEYLEENVMNIIEIALMCTQLAALRPTMSEVYLMLSSEPKLEQRQMSNPTFIDAHRRIYKVGS
ncbi:putative protein kinase RLK-Pelle-DLSV family [Helianthus annuus]|uniref:Putative gnk2-like domain-containing protein n=1 Tax=Helianthus annuus TaxID=4232 RepID=A0A251UHT6_HELAN|nr:cysteine-rich receptor-like protein kinase 2 [Helianthus annuus]KAF5803331.1 putative protein kinase RLK-Pelle-DLSV family [Helianthus annuus]KAJ0567921.1 putative protein kinase RLK-Pelle-DLSV family [Helianthus annuus]KAJ0574363.1 putative protein kinase RLK-Pelle-DLSV family [Helianthus annuus]KAJ0741586.1 putative protein kinase RLK-Pelle-DLSV family [Helianthus annuus]KAJ0916352.1 putative protein kinase RLK-Pelle-DLSV family [Helianthus annuus]